VEKKVQNLAEYIFPLILLFSFIIFIIFARKAIFPFILSIALAYILNPVVNYFEVRGIKRIYVVSGLYIVVGILFIGLLFVIFNFMSFDIESVKITWPNYYSKIQKVVFDINSFIVKFIPFLSGFKIEEKVSNYLLEIPNYIINFLPFMILIFIVPFISFFILISGSSFFDYILDHIPAKYVELFLHITTRIDESLGNYLRGILTEAFIIFFISFWGLFFLNIEYFSLIAILIGFSSLVPYLGAIVGAVVSSLIAYFQYQNIIIVLKVIIFFALIRFFDDWFLQPYIMKRAVKLNPALIIFALMAGAELWGFWGVVFAIPFSCLIKEILLISLELQETEFSWKPKPEPTRISIPYT